MKIVLSCNQKICQKLLMIRSSLSPVFRIIDSLKQCVKLIRKHLHWSHFGGNLLTQIFSSLNTSSDCFWIKILIYGKCVCVGVRLWQMCMCVCCFTSVITLLEIVKTEALSSNFKSTKLVLQIGCPSFYLISWRKSALIQNPSSPIPKIFNRHGIAERQKICRCKCFNMGKYLKAY